MAVIGTLITSKSAYFQYTIHRVNLYLEANFISWWVSINAEWLVNNINNIIGVSTPDERIVWSLFWRKQTRPSMSLKIMLSLLLTPVVFRIQTI